MSIVSASEAQAFCRVPDGTDASLFTLLIEAAESWIEETFGIGLSEATHIEWLDGGSPNLWPSYYPIVSVTEVYDEEDEAAEDSSYYYLRGRWAIRRDGGTAWPAGSGRLGKGRYKVTYVAGFGGTYDVPPVLKLAVLQLVARAYDNRGELASEASAGHSMNWRELAGTDVWNVLLSIKPVSLVG